jgi:hypothetical protein
VARLGCGSSIHEDGSWEENGMWFVVGTTRCKLKCNDVTGVHRSFAANSAKMMVIGFGGTSPKWFQVCNMLGGCPVGKTENRRPQVCFGMS